jgi:hypothetical protein
VRACDRERRASARACCPLPLSVLFMVRRIAVSLSIQLCSLDARHRLCVSPASFLCLTRLWPFFCVLPPSPFSFSVSLPLERRRVVSRASSSEMGSSNAKSEAVGSGKCAYCGLSLARGAVQNPHKVSVCRRCGAPTQKSLLVEKQRAYDRPHVAFPPLQRRGASDPVWCWRCVCRAGHGPVRATSKVPVRTGTLPSRLHRVPSPRR